MQNKFTADNLIDTFEWLDKVCSRSVMFDKAWVFNEDGSVNVGGGVHIVLEKDSQFLKFDSKNNEFIFECPIRFNYVSGDFHIITKGDLFECLSKRAEEDKDYPFMVYPIKIDYDCLPKTCDGSMFIDSVNFGKITKDTEFNVNDVLAVHPISFDKLKYEYDKKTYEEFKKDYPKINVKTGTFVWRHNVKLNQKNV